MRKSLRGVVTCVVAAAAFVVTTLPAVAQTTPLPTAATGDAAVKTCINQLNAAPTDATGALEGAVPAPCKTAMPLTANAVADTNLLSSDPLIQDPFNPFLFGGYCGSYVPPSVTVVPTNPIPGGQYSATGINWPPNASIFGYSIGYNSIGLPLGIFTLAFFNTNAAGQFLIGGTIDSRPVAYYDLYFVSLQCPGVQVTLRVIMGTAGSGGTTTIVSTTTSSVTTTSAGATTTTAAAAPAATTTVATAVLGETTTPGSSGTDASSSGTGVLGETLTRGTAGSGNNTPGVSSGGVSSAGLAFTGGSQNLLAWFAVLLGVAGWFLLRVSRRRIGEPTSNR